jgi:hypothetical protein
LVFLSWKTLGWKRTDNARVETHGKRWSGNALRRKRWRCRPWKTLEWKRTAAKALAFSPVENAAVQTHAWRKC